MISWENYEEYMMLSADGELKLAEEQELAAFLNANPALKSEMAAFRLAHLPPDEAMVYPDKKTLLRNEPAKRTINFPQWRKYAIAASIAALLFIPLYKFSTVNNGTGKVAKKDTIKPTMPVPETNSTIPNAAGTPQSIAAIPMPDETVPVKHYKKPGGRPHGIGPVNKKQHEAFAKAQPQNEARTAPEPASGMAPQQIQALSVARTLPLPCGSTETRTAVAINVPELPAPFSNTTKKSLVDKLPLDESNKHQFKILTRIITNTYAGVSKAKQQLDGQEITFSVEDKKLKVSF